MSDVKTSGGWFLPALTIVFVIAKLTGYIGWSWWWVFSPIWLPVTVILGVAGLLWITGTIVGWATGR